MRGPSRRLTGVAVVVATLAALFLIGARRLPWSQPPAPACIQYWPEARLHTYGYDHVVHVGSTCSTTAQCSVRTNVDPALVQVDVPRNAQIEVITRRESPAREFTAFVTCRLSPPHPAAEAPDPELAP